MDEIGEGEIFHAEGRGNPTNERRKKRKVLIVNLVRNAQGGRKEPAIDYPIVNSRERARKGMIALLRNVFMLIR